MTFSDILVLVAAGMFVLGYLVLNQIVLRILLFVGTLLYIWYYAVVDATPLWPAIWASVATGSANLIGMITLIYSRSRWAIPKRFRDLYEHFRALPPGEFATLMKAANRVTRPAGYRLTTIGSPVETLYFVVDGSVEIEKNGECFSVDAGIFVGEIGYRTGRAASATVRLATEGELLEWNVARLKKRAARNLRFGLAIDTIISLDLAEKVTKSGSPRLPEPR
ncbi:cyclic nucleotide-binding domain-containing protein [Maliponia aquimaris]|uniref:Cyclic nucleotide-gated potassium channel n=1 Tax=Maliponia aquimaris TaxID=1673631 RepID=A0A238L8M1_9RHOB|nr:cyclic nucleotide-binding domain-containing protein [Maliponia aquimaris]SMX50656.1 Cyclic nucleotide-gated potassium channel [Maliponia aquimaris]